MRDYHVAMRSDGSERIGPARCFFRCAGRSSFRDRSGFLPILALLAGAATAQDPSWAADRLGRMSLAEKAGQLLFPAIHPEDLLAKPEAWDAIERDLGRFGVGGVHVFRCRAETCTDVVSRMQRTAAVPLLITADFEGGPGYILRGATRYPRGMGLAATGDEDLVRRVGAMTAAESAFYGVNVDFYPVMDVNSSPDNPIINLRSFGDTPEQVARFGTAYLRGIQESGVMLATAKHFPGHGDTTTDSHLDLPVLDAGRDRLDAIELPPFRAAVAAGVGAVMSAHIAWPRVTGDPALPATLAPQVLTGILRDEMRFGGLVFTDALPMKGLSNRYPPEDAAVRAVAAGADVILFAQDVPKLSAALVAAVEDGRIPAARLDAAARRVLEAKQRIGLNGRPGSRFRTREFPIDVFRHRFRETALEAVRKSFTSVRSRRPGPPLGSAPVRRLLLVIAADAGESRDWEPAGPALKEALRGRVGSLTVADLDERASGLDEILKAAPDHDAVLVAGFASVAAYRGGSGLSAAQASALKDLAATGAVFLGLGNPYGLRGAGAFATIVLAYDVDPLTQAEAAGALSGDFPLTGRLPVTLAF